MNLTRVGKIAHLPREIRELLNRRLLDGETGRQLVAWLNSLPEVQAVMHRDFDGRAITEQNLSEWRQGGYREWFNHQEAMLYAQTLAADAREITDTLHGSPSDHLAAVIATKFAVAIGQWDGQPNPALRKTLDTLGEISEHLEELRRGDHSAARIKLEQARIAIDGARAEKDVFEKFREWLSGAEGWRYINGPDGLSNEERLARLAQLLSGKEPIAPVRTANTRASLSADPAENLAEPPG